MKPFELDDEVEIGGSNLPFYPQGANLKKHCGGIVPLLPLK